MASKKPKAAPIPRTVPDTTDRDKRETMRSAILDRVRDAMVGCTFGDLAKAAGVKLTSSDPAETRMFSEVVSTLTANGTITTRKVGDATVYEMGKPAGKAPKKGKKSLAPSDRAELAQSVDEAIASPAVAKKIKAAQTTKIAPSPEEALDKAIAKEINAWKRWHSASALSSPSKVLPEEWAPGAVENATEEALYRLADAGKIRRAEREDGYVYAPRQMAKDAPGGPEDPAPPEETAPQAPASDIHSLPLGLLRVSPSNPRRRVGDLTELAASMKSSGQLAPIVVRPHPTEAGAFEVVCGHRRSAAAQFAGIAELLVVVRHLSDREVLEAQIAENSQRVDVHPLEEADAIDALHRTHRVPVEEIAAQLGRPVAFVHARLRLLRLAPAARTALEAGRVTLAVALELARLPMTSQDEALPRVLAPEGSAPRTLADVRPILARYTLRLIEAPFALDDASLPGGSCLRCPKRTGSQAALFSEAEGPDLCTDPACYQGKVSAQGDRTPMIAQDPAPIGPKKAKAPQDRPSSKGETAPIAQDRAGNSPIAPPSTPPRAPAAPVDPPAAPGVEPPAGTWGRTTYLCDRLRACPLDGPIFLALATRFLADHHPALGQALRQRGVKVASLNLPKDLRAALATAPAEVIWALWCEEMIGSDEATQDFVSGRLLILDHATTPPPGPVSLPATREQSLLDHLELIAQDLGEDAAFEAVLRERLDGALDEDEIHRPSAKEWDTLFATALLRDWLVVAETLSSGVSIYRQGRAARLAREAAE